MFNAQDVELTIYSVNGDAQKQREMTDRGGGRTVAQVFIHNRPVGGFDQLTALDMDQELKMRLGPARQHYS